uniref:G-protein coupled receptors family 1 profile domain-containing protein n=1 Tax=Panagrolaimus davidi TaxID=227884 RepID=A0A914QQF9_9BILA
MNHYLFNPESYKEFYNCSYYDINIHPLQERQDIFYGIILIVGALIFEIMYMLVIPILWQPTFQKESCYKMMAYIAVIDILAITINGVLTGVFAILGAVFCSFPPLQIFGGMMALFIWVAESDLAVILAFNRCLSMAFPSLCKSIFTQNRTHLWFALSILHATILAFCTDTLTFNALYGVWIVNPHLGYPQTGREVNYYCLKIQFELYLF